MPFRRPGRLLGPSLLVALALPPAAAAPRVHPVPEGWTTLSAPGIVLHAPPEAAPLGADILRAAPQALRAIRDEAGISLLEETVAVYLVTTEEAAARAEAAVGGAPEWAAGYALRGRAAIVLRTRTRYGPLVAELDEVLRHELVHVAADRWLGPRTGAVPRWFHEGAAAVLAHEGRFAEAAWLSRQAIFGPRLPVSAVEGVLTDPTSTPESIRAAYLESYAAVALLVKRRGPYAVGAVFGGVAAGRSFEEAFADAAGEPLPDFLARHERSFRTRYRLVPILTSGTTLWTGIVALFVWAGIAKRRRAAARLRRMREEDPWWEWDADDPRVQ